MGPIGTWKRRKTPEKTQAVRVYFITARKTREPVSKALANNLKEKTEKSISLKAELDKLKAELATEKEANGKIASSKKSSNVLGKNVSKVVVSAYKIKATKSKLPNKKPVVESDDDQAHVLNRKRSKLPKHVVGEDDLKIKRTKMKVVVDEDVERYVVESIGALKIKGNKSKLDGGQPVVGCDDVESDALKGGKCKLALG